VPVTEEDSKRINYKSELAEALGWITTARGWLKPVPMPKYADAAGKWMEGKTFAIAAHELKPFPAETDELEPYERVLANHITEAIVTKQHRSVPEEVVYVPISLDEFRKIQNENSIISYPMISEKGLAHQIFSFEVEKHYQAGWKVLHKQPAPLPFTKQLPHL